MTSARRFVLAALGVALTLALWEAAATLGWVRNLPTIEEVSSRLLRAHRAGSLTFLVKQTSVQWAVGLSATCLIAIPLGIVLGMSDSLRRFSMSTVDFLRAVPPIILLPLFVLVMGSGLDMVAALILFGAVWPLLIHTMAGVRSLDDLTLDTARSFRLPRRTIFFRVLLPAAVPLLVTGLRISAALALFIAVAAELIAGSPGLGRAIAEAQLVGDVALMYGLIGIAGILGLAINSTFHVLERHVLHWHPSQRAG